MTRIKTIYRSPERIQFLAGLLIGAVENDGYGGLTDLEWYCPDGAESDWYAVMCEKEGNEPNEYRVDLDTMARGIGVISRSVLKATPEKTREYVLDGQRHEYTIPSETVLHNAKTGEPLYLDEQAKRDIVAASFENDAAGSEHGGDLDVNHYLAIMECGIYGRVVYA